MPVEIHIVKPIDGKYPEPGFIVEGEPFARPWVKLDDGTVMSYQEWYDAGMPSTK